MELEYQCKHEGAYIEKACCSPWDVGDSGYIECGCGGRDYIVCPAPMCEGLNDFEMETLWPLLEVRA